MKAGEDKTNLPYSVGYAKTSRSKCKGKDCGENIDEGKLRMAVRRNTQHGLIDINFHAECFWSTPHRNMSEGVIRGFEHLKWEDQEKIREWIYHKSGGEPREYKNAMAEYARSGKSKCAECSGAIESRELRVTYLSKGFFHPECLAEKHIYLKLGEEMTNFGELEEDDQERLRTLFTGPNEDDKRKEGATQLDQMPIKDLTKAIGQAENDEQARELTMTKKLKQALKRQTELIWEVKGIISDSLIENRDLRTAKAKKEALEVVIAHNGGSASGTLEELITFLADIVVFGGFEPCPECNATNFCYSIDKHAYQCVGGKSLCSFYAHNVLRKPFELEDDFEDLGLGDYDQKQLLPDGRAYPKSVIERVEEGRMVLVNAPVKIFDPTRKRKKEPEGTMKDNGFSVDAQFNEGADFHVYLGEGNVPHQFLLQKVDPANGNNKFYKIQMLESDVGDEWVVFRRYGVICSPSSTDMHAKFSKVADALKLFKKLFKEKTGTDWANVAKYAPKQDKYRLVEWSTNLAGTYGRTTEESRADNDGKSKGKAVKAKPKAKKPKKDVEPKKAAPKKPKKDVKLKKPKKAAPKKPKKDVEPKKAAGRAASKKKKKVVSETEDESFESDQSDEVVVLSRQPKRILPRRAAAAVKPKYTVDTKSESESETGREVEEVSPVKKPKRTTRKA